MAHDRLAALRIELRDAVLLDVLLTAEPELLLDRELDRQAVAIPAGLPRDVEALHRAVARENVLEDSSFDVVGTGGAIGRGRALVEHPGGATGAGGDRGLEDALGLPHIEHGMLHGRQINLRWHGPVHECSFEGEGPRISVTELPLPQVAECGAGA